MHAAKNAKPVIALCGVILEHYIISSGIKEMIEGTTLHKNAYSKKYTPAPIYMNNTAWRNGRPTWLTTQRKHSIFFA